MQVQKKAYVKPEVKNHGSIESLTQGGARGSFLDASFTVTTSTSLLTFS